MMKPKTLNDTIEKYDSDFNYTTNSQVNFVTLYAPNLKLNSSISELYDKNATNALKSFPCSWYVNKNISGSYTKDEVLNGDVKTNFKDRFNNNTFKTRFIAHILPMSNNQANRNDYKIFVKNMLDSLDISNYYELRYIAKGHIGTIPLYELDTGDLILLSDNLNGHTPYYTAAPSGNRWQIPSMTVGSGQGVNTFSLSPGMYNDKLLNSVPNNFSYKSLTYMHKQCGLVVSTAIAPLVYKHAQGDANDTIRLYPIGGPNTDFVILNMKNIWRIAAGISQDVNRAHRLCNYIFRGFTILPLVLRNNDDFRMENIIYLIRDLINAIIYDDSIDFENAGFDQSDNIQLNMLTTIFNKYIKTNYASFCSLYSIVGMQSLSLLESVTYSSDTRSNLSVNGALPTALFNSKFRYNSLSTSTSVMQWLEGSYLGSTIAGQVTDNGVWGTYQAQYIVKINNIDQVYNRGFSNVDVSKPSVHYINNDLGSVTYDDGGGLMVTNSFFNNYEEIELTESQLTLVSTRQ